MLHRECSIVYPSVVCCRPGLPAAWRMKEAKRQANQQRLQELREQRQTAKKRMQELVSRPLLGRKDDKVRKSMEDPW